MDTAQGDLCRLGERCSGGNTVAPAEFRASFEQRAHGWQDHWLVSGQTDAGLQHRRGITPHFGTLIGSSRDGRGHQNAPQVL